MKSLTTLFSRNSKRSASDVAKLTHRGHVHSAAIAAALLASAAAMAFDDSPTDAPAEVAHTADETGATPGLRLIPDFDPDAIEIPDFFGDAKWLNAPFSTLAGDMDSAVADLDVGRTEPPAEYTQPLIIDRLDTMIEMLEKACKGGGGNNAGRPANASTLRSGADKRGPMRTPQQDGRKWAELTAQEREKILQSKTDGFPAGYDDILADYFRKLSRAEAAPSGESNNAE